MKGIIVSVTAFLALSGCSSPSQQGPKSVALTIAEQTYLTQDYEVLWSTIESPLKDYSQEDIDGIQEAFARKSPGDTALIFGALRVLSGDFTGAIDLAGGTAANISTSNHPASYSGWFVAIPQAEVKDGQSAQIVARDTIQSTAIELLEEHGVYLEKVVINPERKSMIGATIYQETEYRIKGSDTSFGFYEDEYYMNDEQYEFVEGTTTFLDDKKQYVTSHDTRIGGVHGFNQTYFVENSIHPFSEPDGFDVYMKELTKRLPKGYMYYMAPKSSTTLIPALFIEGNKYNFIQPSVEQSIVHHTKATGEKSRF